MIIPYVKVVSKTYELGGKGYISVVSPEVSESGRLKVYIDTHKELDAIEVGEILKLERKE